MEKLFKEKEIFQKERPVKLTDSQKKEFYLKLAEEVIKNNWSTDDEEAIAEDLSNLSFYDNGYEMAKELEGCHSDAYYDIDPSFCEWLDDIEHLYRREVDENVKVWVKAHEIKPKYSKGTKLNVLMDFSQSFKRGDVIYITGIYENTALYVLHSDPDHKGGVLIPFEKVEKCCSTY